jgi:signal-transduction protein with cAMP-binding, CBS, and nucleotidyltransferase domain
LFINISSGFKEKYIENTKLNDTLRQVPLFAQLSDSELTCLEQGEELWLPQGAAFITEGEPAENFYVLLA